MGLVLAVVGAALTASSVVGAEEPRTVHEPRMLQETGEITSVVDAFDDDDAFDVSLMLGFRQEWQHANIRRETSLNQPGLSDGGYVAKTENVATYSESTSTLLLGADVGLFKDLAFKIRLPLVLQNSRELGDLDGSTANPQRLADPAGGQLFSVPFKSPTRSGLEYLGLGLDYAIFNQVRNPTKPTWVVGVETRIGIGTPLHACNDGAATGQAKCPDPVTTSIDRDPGMSRATTALLVHTTFSKRFGEIEPYTGFSFLAEFPHAGSEFGNSAPTGALVQNPPMVGTIMAGTEYVPYERKEQFQRIVLDGRLSAAYQSVGRDYSPLFDALGTTGSSSLRQPNPTAYRFAADNATSVQDPNAPHVYFNGITETQAHGRITIGGGVTYQAGEFVKFNAGGSYTWVQSYLLSGADACNPTDRSRAETAGPCHGNINGGVGPQPVTGVPNPYYRPVIDLPGHRFSVDDGGIVQLYLNGIVMF